MTTRFSVPDHRLAICRRCRWPERIACGADSAERLLECARDLARDHEPPYHARLSQCLNSCDGGHTVRVEYRGREIALVGIRTADELRTVLAHIAEIADDRVPARLRKRVYQVWEDGRLTWHLNRSR